MNDFENDFSLCCVWHSSQKIVKLCAETCCNVFQCDIIMPHFFRVSIAVVNRFDFLKRQYRCLSRFPDDAIGIRFRFNFQFRVQDDARSTVALLTPFSSAIRSQVFMASPELSV